MRSLFLSVFLLLAFTLSSFSLHKYYVSLTKIEIDTNTSQIKLYTELFVDDFEKLLIERYNFKKIDFLKISEEQEDIIRTYVENKLELKINRKPTELNYLGCEVEGELIYVYLEGKAHTKKVGRVDVYNSILQEIFTEQQNKVDIKFKDNVRSVNLNTGVPFGTVYF